VPDVTATDWYALIDAAQDARLHGLIAQCEARCCLFSGRLSPRFAAAAPWLVRIDPREPLVRIWQVHGRGRNWGVMCEAEGGPESLRRHFRRFLQASLPDGTVAQFRFYDPRVFLAYMFGAGEDERRPWFEGIRQFVVEGADGAEHSLRLRGGQLYDGDQPAGKAA
jgi:hypothetical protein